MCFLNYIKRWQNYIKFFKAPPKNVKKSLMQTFLLLKTAVFLIYVKWSRIFSIIVMRGTKKVKRFKSCAP